MNPPAMRHAARQEPSASGAAPPAATPQFFFARVDDMLTCTAATIYWAYAGPSDSFQMVITNDDVPQIASVPPISSSSSSTDRPPATFTNAAVPRAEPIPTGVISETINANIAPFESPFTWRAVNVPQGWYKLTASLPSASYTTDSRAFFVHNSSDVSCLIAPPPPPSPSQSTTFTSTSSSTSPSQTIFPISGASSSSISKGAIAGSVIGGMAIVFACIAAFLFIRYSKRSVASRQGGASRSRNWGGLGSVDSVGGNKSSSCSARRPKSSLAGGAAAALGLASADKSNRAERHNSRADSVDPIFGTGPSPNPGGFPRPSQSSSISKEDVSSSVHSPFDEKYMDATTIDSLPPLPLQRDTSIGQTSVATSNTRATSQTRRSSTSSTTHPRLRRISIDHSATGELIQMTPSPSTPSTPFTPSHAPSRSQSQAGFTPTASILPAGGISSPTSNRRSARKPVPSYNPEDISLSPFLPSVESPRSASAATAYHHPSSSSTDVFAGGDEDKLSIHSGHGIRPPGFPDLNHKSSFGPGDNRPVHYLIPDMPPPQKD